MAHNIEILKEIYAKYSDNEYAFCQAIIKNTNYFLTIKEIMGLKSKAATAEEFDVGAKEIYATFKKEYMAILRKPHA